MEKLGYGEYKEEIEEIAKTCKEKRRKQSTRLENLGIPEEELYRQQQELFAKVYFKVDIITRSDLWKSAKTKKVDFIYEFVSQIILSHHARF